MALSDWIYNIKYKLNERFGDKYTFISTMNNNIDVFDTDYNWLYRIETTRLVEDHFNLNVVKARPPYRIVGTIRNIELE